MLALDGLYELMCVDNYVTSHKRLINSYKCEECHYAITTVDKHVGDTPFKTICLAPSPCRGTMVSSAYRGCNHVDTYEGQITHEWYRPLSSLECSLVRDEIHRAVERDIEHLSSQLKTVEERDLERTKLLSDYSSWLTSGGLHIRAFTGKPQPREFLNDLLKSAPGEPEDLIAGDDS